MKNSFPLLFVLIITLSGRPCWGQLPYAQFAQSIGGMGQESAFGVRTDETGRSYVAGSFTGATTFGQNSFTSQGSSDAFISRINADGSYAWTRVFGGPGQDWGRIAIFDAGGNCYLTGGFKDSMMVGTTRLKSLGGEDIFIIKLNSMGEVVWVRSYGGAGANAGIGMSMDPSGHLICIGYFSDGMQMGDSSFVGLGSFIVKMNQDGNLIWCRSTKWSTCNGVKSDANGNIFLCGSFLGTQVFGNATLVSKGGLDAVLGKVDANGNFLWARSFGGPEWDQSLALDVDTAGNPCVTGDFEGTITVGDTTVTSNGNKDAFVTQWSKNGNYLWGWYFGSAGMDQGQGLAVNHSGDCFAIGYYSNPMTVNNQMLPSPGGIAPWVIKLHENGGFQWIRPLKTHFGIGRDISVDSFGDCYATGYYSDSLRFGSAQLTSGGSTDGFLIKFSDVATNVSKPQTAGVRIFPNPTSRFVTMETAEILLSACAVDLLGRPFQVGAVAMGKLDVSHLKPGCYFLRLQLASGVYAKPLTIE